MSQVLDKQPTKQRLEAAQHRVDELKAAQASFREQIAEIVAALEGEAGNEQALERYGGRLSALERLDAANVRKLEAAQKALAELSTENEHERLLLEHERLITLWLEQNKQYKETNLSVVRSMLDLARRLTNIDLERSNTSSMIRQIEKELKEHGTNKLFRMGDIYKEHEVTPSQETADAVGVHKSQVAALFAALSQIRRAAAFTGEGGVLPRVR